MVFPKARLVVSAGLFLAWIGFLAYLVARTRDPVILSRPQLVVSSVVLIADIKEQNGRPVSAVAVTKVASALAPEDKNLAGSQLTIEGLADVGHAQGWREPGTYILPLTKRKMSAGYAYEVTSLPMSPGYRPEYVTVELMRVGPEKDKVSALVHSLIGGTGEVAPGVLRRDVPQKDAVEFKRIADALGANVRLSEGESRIYLATADALAQLEELKAKER
jgi:hypothetical protein